MSVNAEWFPLNPYLFQIFWQTAIFISFPQLSLPHLWILCTYAVFKDLNCTLECSLLCRLHKRISFCLDHCASTSNADVCKFKPKIQFFWTVWTLFLWASMLGRCEFSRKSFKKAQKCDQIKLDIKWLLLEHINIIHPVSFSYSTFNFE